jgi:hypothetical protein
MTLSILGETIGSLGFLPNFPAETASEVHDQSDRGPMTGDLTEFVKMFLRTSDALCRRHLPPEMQLTARRVVVCEARCGRCGRRVVGREGGRSCASAAGRVLTDSHVARLRKHLQIVNDVRVGNEARGGIHCEYFRAFLRF